MDLEKLLRSLLYRLESIDDESKSTVIEDKVNKLSHQISQLKSDLSDVASLFHLLKNNKERLTLLNIEDTDYLPWARIPPYLLRFYLPICNIMRCHIKVNPNLYDWQAA